MNRNYSESDLSQARLSSQSAIPVTTSFRSPPSSTKGSGHKFDSPKPFQRKTTFKTFQRKQKQSSNQNPKITYISPQKSDLFKKYGSYPENPTELSLSMLTDNSNDFLLDNLTKRSYKPLSLLLDLQESRSVLNEINNFKPDNGFMTPKNGRNQTNWASPNTLRKSSAKRLKNEQPTVANQETDFNTEFNTLNQIREPTFGFYSTTKFPSCDSERRISKFSSKERKENCSPQIFESLPLDSRVKSIDMELEMEKLKVECRKLKIQKNQIQDSSRIFLDEIKGLQLKLDSEIDQKNKAIQQTTALREILTQKDKQIANLTAQIKNLEQINEAHKLNEQQQTEHLKGMYLQLSQKVKYMSVENGILKKMLEQKKEEGFKIERLQNLNKKLTSRNKFLTKALEQIQIQTKETKKLNTPRIPAFSQANKFSQRRPEVRENICKTPLKKAGSMDFEKELKQMSLNLSKVDFSIEDDNFSIISNNSELELSFELSPEKSHWPKMNEDSCIRHLRTANVLH